MLIEEVLTEISNPIQPNPIYWQSMVIYIVADLSRARYSGIIWGMSKKSAVLHASLMPFVHYFCSKTEAKLREARQRI